MKKHLIIIYALMALIILSGFTSSDQLVIDSLTKRLEALESKYKIIDERSFQNFVDIIDIKYQYDQYAKCYFDATNPGSGYSRLDNEKGTFYVALDSVTKNGSS